MVHSPGHPNLKDVKSLISKKALKPSQKYQKLRRFEASAAAGARLEPERLSNSDVSIFLVKNNMRT